MTRRRTSSAGGASMAVVLCVMGLARESSAQQTERPPDFSQRSIAAASDDVGRAWDTWQASDKDLERRVFGLPMVDARQLIQKAFSNVLAYFDKRHTYEEAVAASIVAPAPGTTAGEPLVSVNAVNVEEVELLSVSISIVGRKLDVLRDSSQWRQIRRSIQKENSEVLELERTRRDDIRIERPLDRFGSSARPISAAAYRESEHQVRESLTKLWTRYYQALVDAVEEKLGQSTPLVSSASHAGGDPADNSLLAATPTGNSLVGTWTYAEGSQQFNGVSEPKHVILELWMENGYLAGRYRAELADFDRTRKVDLSLRGKSVGGRTVLDFRSSDPEGAGKIEIEGPGNGGSDVMLIHSDAAPIPRGRELLTRR